MTQPNARGVDRKHALEIITLNLVGRLQLPANSGIVECVVYSAKLLDGLLDAVVYGFLVGYVQFDLLD